MIPITIEILEIFEPMILPIANSLKPFKADCRLTNSSGNEVANETIVIPIIVFGIFNLLDRTIELFTNNCVPQKIMSKEIINSTKNIVIIKFIKLKLII